MTNSNDKQAKAEWRNSAGILVTITPDHYENAEAGVRITVAEAEQLILDLRSAITDAAVGTDRKAVPVEKQLARNLEKAFRSRGLRL